MQICGIVAGYEVRFVYQISAVNGACSETQMGYGQSPGFFGIIFKVALCGHIRVVADDFDGVFGGADRAVPTQAPEFTGDDILWSGFGYCGNFQ